MPRAWERRESGEGEGLEEIGRVGEALGREKIRYWKGRGMETAIGVSRETTGWEQASPQGLRVIEVSGVVGEAMADRGRMGRARWIWKG